MSLRWCTKQKELVNKASILFLILVTGYVLHLSFLVDLRTAQAERHANLMVLPQVNNNTEVKNNPASKRIYTASSDKNSTHTNNDDNSDNNVPTRETELADDSMLPGRIPHRLVFTHHANILQDKKPPQIYDNIMFTIEMYQKAWNEPNASVWFLDNNDCQTLIQEVEPALVPHFIKERRGAFKGDICRVAALYLKGGYYFDVDMKAIQALDVEKDVSFASALLPDRKGFFQSFLASEPKSLILKEALRLMLDYYNTMLQIQTDIRDESIPVPDLIDLYEDKIKFKSLQGMSLSEHYYSFWNRDNTTDPRELLLHLVEKSYKTNTIAKDLMGPSTLKQAYDKIVYDYNQNYGLGDTLLLQEINLELRNEMYPDLERQDGMGCCCQFVVHDGERPYFWSRMVGVTRRCVVKKGDGAPQKIKFRLGR